MDWKEVSTHDQRHQREPITSAPEFGTEILDCVFSENVDGIGVEDLPDVMQRSVEDLVIMETEATELHKKIEKLSEQEQFIIKSIYFDGIKQVELAKLLGISKVRMSQKVNAILKKMRKMYEAEN